MEKKIPLVTINKIEDVEKVCGALCASNLKMAEITFRTECAQEAIKLACEKFPDMEIGAGTVINGKQCKQAIAAGAKFIVSPGISEEVAKICAKKKIPYYPGCVTPTEIMKALSLGITVVKFFPANVYGGLQAMKALAAPFPQIRFIPTGGVNSDNIREFLAWDRIVAVGGSFLTKEALSRWQK